VDDVDEKDEPCVDWTVGLGASPAGESTLEAVGERAEAKLLPTASANFVVDSRRTRMTNVCSVLEVCYCYYYCPQRLDPFLCFPKLDLGS
jgi:hypothetical protein